MQQAENIFVSNRNFRLAIFSFALIALTFLGPAKSCLMAQEGSGASATATFENGEAPAKLPIKHSGGGKLTEQQNRGAGLFIQRCALCHLNKTNKACCLPALGPNLSGLFKNINSNQEQAMRKIIMDGGPTYMPAWKFALSSKDIDDILAYLKTLD